MPPQPRYASSLETNIVIVVKIVDPDDFNTPVKQSVCCLRADKARGTSYKNLHAAGLLREGIGSGELRRHHRLDSRVAGFDRQDLLDFVQNSVWNDHSAQSEPPG